MKQLQIKNQFTIGISLGIGNALGIGMDAQPDIDIADIANNRQNISILALSVNFEYSPVHLYDMAQNQGFRQAFPGIL